MAQAFFTTALLALVMFAGAAWLFTLDSTTTGYEKSNPADFWKVYKITVVIGALFVGIVTAKRESWSVAWATGVGAGIGMATGAYFGEYLHRGPLSSTQVLMIVAVISVSAVLYRRLVKHLRRYNTNILV
ncbi:MAG: hypothetical protein HYT39_03630 [Candidatus Sungbacteria bacterium]|nr:hypothetical protein [Candidatus Sungbacteria bacterium]